MNVHKIKLSDASSINPRLFARPTTDAPVSFLGMSDVNAESGCTSRGVDRQFGEVAKGYTQFIDGDLLVAKITPCFQNGKIAQANLGQPHGAGSTEFHVIRPDRSRLHDRFLLWFLRQPYIRIAGERRMTGSGGQRRVPEAYLANLDIPTPPLEEQKRIAQVLDEVDALRTKRREAIILLNELAQSLFLDMFGDPVVNPMRWNRNPMSSFLERIDSGKSPKCLERPASSEEWGVLKLSSVTQGTYAPGENKALPAGTEIDDKNEVQAGDLLFTRKNTPDLVATSVYVEQTTKKLLIPDLIFRLVNKHDAPVDRVYLHNLIAYPSKRKKLQALASGSSSSMSNISKAKLLNFECEIPPLNLQQKFTSRLKQIQTARAAHQSHLAKLDELFASLQYRAFRGELWDSPAA